MIESITDSELATIGIIRLNQMEKKQEVRKTFRIGRLGLTYHWQSKKSLWGRFGGGWNWEFGFVAGGREIIFNLLICSLRFSVAKAEGTP